MFKIFKPEKRHGRYRGDLVAEEISSFENVRISIFSNYATQGIRELPCGCTLRRTSQKTLQRVCVSTEYVVMKGKGFHTIYRQLPFPFASCHFA